MTKYAKCDSCGGIYPEDMVKKMEFDYTVFTPGSKRDLVTNSMYGMICANCGQQKPTTTAEEKAATPQKTSAKPTSYGRKK